MRVACVYIPHFYLRIEQLRNPALKDKPVVLVAMPEERGFVLDCSETLIKRGVCPQMSLREASHLCYDAIPVFVQRRDYVQIWDDILSSIAEITLRMEPKETGTVFLDVTRLPGMYKSEEQLALALAGLMSDRFHLRAQIGVGNSRFMAKEAALFRHKGHICRQKGYRTDVSFQHRHRTPFCLKGCEGEAPPAWTELPRTDRGLYVICPDIPIRRHRKNPLGDCRKAVGQFELNYSIKSVMALKSSLFVNGFCKILFPVPSKNSMSSNPVVIITGILEFN